MKEKIMGIFGNKSLVFNKEFDSNLNMLKDDMIGNLLEWCRKIKEGRIPHIPIANKKFRNYILFIDKIADKRVMVVRIKNSDYIEMHLSSHEYYDLQRKRFGIKKGSRYY